VDKHARYGLTEKVNDLQFEEKETMAWWAWRFRL